MMNKVSSHNIVPKNQMQQAHSYIVQYYTPGTEITVDTSTAKVSIQQIHYDEDPDEIPPPQQKSITLEQAAQLNRLVESSNIIVATNEASKMLTKTPAFVCVKCNQTGKNVKVYLNNAKNTSQTLHIF